MKWRNVGGGMGFETGEICLRDLCELERCFEFVPKELEVLWRVVIKGA